MSINLALLLCLLLSFLMTSEAWSQTSFVTPFDTLPNFCLIPTMVSAHDGTMEEASTWLPARALLPTDTVVVTHHVTLNSHLALINLCILGGSVAISREVDTSLKVGTLQVVAGGRLDQGSTEAPLRLPWTHTLVFRDTQPLDVNQYGTGLLVLDGTWTLHGEPKSGFHRLTAEHTLTRLSLDTPPTGWQVGDLLLLPDSRHVPHAENPWTPQWEQAPLLAVDGQDLRTQLLYGHPGARDKDGQLTFLPHVANLTRNVVIRSDNPQGTRGHIWVSRRSTVDVQYGRFEGLGRTTTAPVNTTTNLMGKYWLHLHHLVGPVTPPAHGYQFRVRGNVFDGGAVPHTKKWMLTVHDAHYGLVEDNVFWHCAGACLMTEEGNETANMIAHNLVIRAHGTGDRYGKGSEETGFWLRGPNNSVLENVAANILGTDASSAAYGFSLWQEGAGTQRFPAFQGADTAVAGQYLPRSIYEVPLRAFRGNETYSSQKGITTWWIGTQLFTPKATQESLIQDQRLWHIFFTGVAHYQAHLLTWEGLVIRGGPPRTWTCWGGGDYFASQITIRNSDLQGCTVGIQPPTDTLGGFRIADSLIHAQIGLQMDSLWTAGYRADNVTPTRPVFFPRLVEVRGTTVVPAGPASTFRTISMVYSASANPAKNLRQTDEVRVMGYQGMPGQDVQVYYREQAPAFLVPQTITNADGTPRLLAAPVAGLTNAQTWAQYGVAIAGAVAPCTLTRPEITGLVCPGSAAMVGAPRDFRALVP